MGALFYFCSDASTSHQRIQPLDLADTDIVLPAQNLRLPFHKYIASTLAKLLLSKTMAVSLAKPCDTLLPKLISGELRVKDAERFVGELA
jgi:type I restriction enzyme S subunit